MKQAWALIKAAGASFADDYAMSMGAALAYYTVFSIAPLVFIVIMVTGLLFGEEAASGEIFAQLNGLMGEQGARAVQTMVEKVSEPSTGIIGTIIGAVVLLIGATTVFAELQSSLDRIWRAPARNKPSGIVAIVRARVLSFGMVLAIGFLLIVSLVASAALAAMGHWWGPLLGGWEVLAQVLNFVISFGLVTAGFALIYKFMPAVKIEWRDVWVGAAVTALLFTIGKFAIGLYIGKSAIASGFGAAGSIAVVLVWVYYSSLIFLLGAEFTWVYSHAHGSRRGEAIPTVGEVPSRELVEAVTAQAAADQQPVPVVASVSRASHALANRAGDAPPRRPRSGIGAISAPVAFGLGCLLTAVVAVLPGGRAAPGPRQRSRQG